MPLPSVSQVLNGKRKSLAHIANKNPRFVLIPVPVQGISVAKPMRIIVADNGSPCLGNVNF